MVQMKTVMPGKGKYSATVRYLVNQMILGNLTYDEVTTARADLKPQIDAYIAEYNIELPVTGETEITE